MNGQAYVDELLAKTDSLWLHSGREADPHAELTSGKHSDGFVDTLRAISYPGICQVFAGMLVYRLREMYTGPIDWVVGSDHAAADISHSVAIMLGARHDFAEKGPDKTQVWKRFAIGPDEVVLQVEDLITTSGTFMAVRQGVRLGNEQPIQFAPYVLAVVHRSEVLDIEGSPILYLAHYDIEVWDPGKCPLCAKGSKALRPKQNWHELTGR